jgi:hypothetical protein
VPPCELHAVPDERECFGELGVPFGERFFERPLVQQRSEADGQYRRNGLGQTDEDGLVRAQ